MPPELQALAPEDRLRLLRFVCSFAWADLEMAESERTFIAELIGKLDLGEEEQDQVQDWIDSPPEAETVDPTEIPLEHRQVFLTTILQMVMADGVVDESEAEQFSVLEQLVR